MVGKKPKSLLPKEPIDLITTPFKQFMAISAASGIVLLLATVAALVLANSSLSIQFLDLWQIPLKVSFGPLVSEYTLQFWVNDLLMAIFFFLVGMEVKREIVVGELREFRNALLPIVAAAGGMIVPALVYLALIHGSPGASGWGIPMATDIAFVVGCLAVLGERVPHGLRVMLLSLAIADDIGAILVIAVGYSGDIHLNALGIGIATILAIGVLIRLGVSNRGIHFVLSLFAWACIHESGIHATITGVILGFVIPARPSVSEGRLADIMARTKEFIQRENWQADPEHYPIVRELEVASRKSLSPLERFETEFHPWVAFLIMPLFAFANAGVVADTAALRSPVALAVGVGLVLGKPLGIISFSWLAVRLGIARLPSRVGWGGLTGGGFLCGIGFTMALFISTLALDSSLIDPAKVGVLAGSTLSAVVGMLILLFTLQPAKNAEDGH